MTGSHRYQRVLPKRERIYADLVCPSCGGATKVIDSRGSRGAIRRRRECLSCLQRFTTYEAVGEQLLDSHGIAQRIMQLLAPVVTDTVRTVLEDVKKL